MSKKPLTKNQRLYTDSAYVGEEIEKGLKKRKYKPMICEKGFRGHPPTEEQKERDREKSRIRCRIDHVFGAMKMFDSITLQVKYQERFLR